MQLLPSPLNSHDRLAVAYRSETAQLTAHRAPIAALSVFAAIVVGGGIEWTLRPQRAGALLVGFAAEIVLCATHILVARRSPRASVPVTQMIVNCTALGLCIYTGVVHGRTVVTLLSLAVLVTGTATFFPWGVRGQLRASVGAVIGYPLALVLGAIAVLPVAYEIFVVVMATGVAALGAHILDGYRRSTLEQQAFSAALLDVGRALNETIGEPEALAEQLTGRACAAMDADWAFLYQWDADGGRFRATAVSHAPPAVAEELRTVDFLTGGPRQLLSRLVDAHTVAVTRDAADESGVPLGRWNLSAVLLQTITREREIIGVLGCCYRTPHPLFSARERELLSAIATQAGVALDNARLVEEARRANRFKSEFVATVSHELRTPLTVIVGYTDLLRDDPAAAFDDEQRDMLQRIHQQCLQLLELIQAMLDLNRLETQQLVLRLEPFSVEDLMRSLRTNLPGNWVRERVTVRWEVSDESVTLRSDRGKVEMVLRNLIHNALKYTDIGSVVISAELLADEQQVRFAVTDTGSGIPATDQAAIFEIFRQGTSNPPRGGGVGLGLYIVKRLTEALGGSVAVESQPGAGSRFTVCLPVEAPSGGENASVPPPGG